MKRPVERKKEGGGREKMEEGRKRITKKRGEWARIGRKRERDKEKAANAFLSER